MKVGDLVKTLDAHSSLYRRKQFVGIIVEYTDSNVGQKTDRITVLTTSGELVQTRASYNILEIISEAR